MKRCVFGLIMTLLLLAACSARREITDTLQPVQNTATIFTPTRTPTVRANTTTPVPTSATGTSTAQPTALPTALPMSTATATPVPAAATATSVEQVSALPTVTPVDPLSLITQESLFAYLEDLTAIQPYSGWRNSGTEGEVEALDYVAATLGEFPYLAGLGLEVERQAFPVFLATELWETRLQLTLPDGQVEVPADGLRGPRDGINQALRFDSDGALNDTNRDLVVVEGEVVLIRTAEQIAALSPSDVQGKVVFLDYAVIDRSLQETREAVGIAWDLLDRAPSGLVLVTQFSNQVGQSHGFGVGDVSALNWVETETVPPILYARIEDMGPAGVEDWDDLTRVQSARLTWDADIFSPGSSGNLIARIPGVDPSQAVILGAHIDSPNAPGAMDDGSGSVVLLEVASVLDGAKIQPPVDLYLCWFGSEELGLYGSSHFVATHQELLDRTLAVLTIDDLTHPLDGIDADLTLVSWSYSRLGDGRLTWPDFLRQAADRIGINAVVQDYHGIYSDNSVFSGFDVPNADLIYSNDPEMEAAGGFHNAAHIHDPYDTVELAREVGDVLEQMARLTLVAALDTDREQPPLRVAPEPDRRAVFVASHTESPHMAPMAFFELTMSLAWVGFDVDLIPSGQRLNAADLDGAALVVALPIVDYPSPDGDPALYDEAWDSGELDVLETYVAQGGLLVLANSARRLKYGNQPLDVNEDWDDVNALAARFGVSYLAGPLPGEAAQPEGGHPLMAGVARLDLALDNAVPFKMGDGQVLARVNGEPAVGLVDYGADGGQVLVLGDVGLLSAGRDQDTNLTFWQNLAQYARRP